LGAVILQGEIPVAGGGAREVGNLAGDPGQGERALEQARDGLVQGADGQHGRGGKAAVSRGVGHHEVGEGRELSTYYRRGHAYVIYRAKQQVLFLSI
jgi:hypothetical protein